MTEQDTDNLAKPEKWTATGVYLVCALLTGGILFLDLATPLGIAVGTLYILVILLSFWSPGRRFTLSVAIICSLLLIGAMLYKPAVEEMWKVVFNRVISLFIIWVTTLLGLRIKQAEAKLVEMATRDFLTGLLTRRELLRRLALEVSRMRRIHAPLSAIMIDIDYFKRVNDTYGHMAGDMLLKQLAQRLVRNMRNYDLLCRYGGEEFLVIAPETATAHARELAERLRRDIMESPFLIDLVDQMVSITVSAGVTGLQPGEGSEAMISRADAALYRAKAAGRNIVVAL
jgi:diguanylate cyclase (GGDEF)-like protein